MSEEGMKLLKGYKLTREEWENARKSEVVTGGVNATYEGFLASYYEDDERYGYICPKHPHRTHTEDDGETWECGWGLHLENFKPKYLTDLNAMYIALCFGRDTLYELLEDKKTSKRGSK